MGPNQNYKKKSPDNLDPHHYLDYEMKFDEMTEAKKAQPDYIDIHGDGNKKEPNEKAVKDKEAKKDKKVHEQRKET